MIKTAPQATILVVEDDKDTALTLSKWLQLYGCQTMVAGSSDDAMLMLNEYAPNIVFLDYWITGRTVSVFVHRLRKNFPKTKLIVTAAAASAPSIGKILGADAWFLKPFDFAAIENYLTHTL